MPHVIAQPCAGCKDSTCWQVCPVDAIHPTPNDPDYEQHDQLYIDPVGCVDCGACVPECPVEAIWLDDELPSVWVSYTEKNSAYYDPPSAA